VHEATAALQDLALRYAPDGESDCAARLTELREIQAQLPCRIQSEPNGPYLVTNAENLTDWLGGPLPATPQMALCRCGQSRLKPLCDGTHAEIGFTAEKDPQRVPDRHETYIGQQVTILDNRGTCQHSGFCTDRLATAFRLGKEPFVMPSGGRMDEIIRAVRDCPSGALSYGFDGVEARDEVDYHGQREPTIEVSKDGPYRITGGIPLTDGDGKEEARNDQMSDLVERGARARLSPVRSGAYLLEPRMGGDEPSSPPPPNFSASDEPRVICRAQLGGKREHRLRQLGAEHPGPRPLPVR